MTSSVRRFGEYFVQSVVARTAESAFKKGVRDFCTHFTPQHVQQIAESGKPFEEVIASCGFKLKPTRPQELNPWQKYILSLPDERLFVLLKEGISQEHWVMLERYPHVTQGIITTVRSMVVAN